jgi:hypothetical protein
VLAPLAVVVGVKLPHDEVPQETDHVTPPLSESLLTLAEMGVVVPTCMVDTRCELSVTTMEAGGGGLLPPVPEQPIVITTMKAAAAKLKQERRRFTGHLR